MTKLWRYRWLLLAVLAFLVGTVVWLRRAPELDDDPVRIARFVSSPKFADLPEIEQRAYMQAIREGRERIYDAFEKKQITAQEYENALLHAWIARTLEYSKQYALLRPGPSREQLLNRVIKQSEENRTSTPRPPDSTRFDTDPYELAEVKQLVATWPADRRSQWDAFRQAVRARRIQRRLPPDSGIWY